MPTTASAATPVHTTIRTPTDAASAEASIVGARPNRSSTNGPPSRPSVIVATNRANPRTPIQWGAAYPSTSESASQSLAAPSASVNASTMAPMASVRGSSQADLESTGSSRSAGSPAGRRRLLATTATATARAGTTE